MNSCFEIDADDLSDVVEEFYPMEIDAASNSQQRHSQNGLAINNVTSIEKSLRQSVTAVS